MNIAKKKKKKMIWRKIERNLLASVIVGNGGRSG